MTEVNELHRLANENDRAAKQRMKEVFDARMKAKECQIRVGNKILMRRVKTNKSMSNWEPDPFTVTRVNHCMLTDNHMKKKKIFFSFRPYKLTSPLKNALIFCYLIDSLRLPIK